MDDWGKKNPLNAEILAEDANQGDGGIAALPTRVGRYGEAHRRALAMAGGTGGTRQAAFAGGSA